MAFGKKKKLEEDDEYETGEDDTEGLDFDLGSALESDDLGSDLESDLDMETEDEMSEDMGDPELSAAASAAFPDIEWDGTRLAALKDLIHLCSRKDYGDEEMGSDDKGGLALVFGEPKKK